MAADDLVVVATFVNNFEAELARGALETSGIDCLIRADDCGGTRPHLWMGGIELVVRAEDADAAREILAASSARPEPPASADGEP